MRPWGGVAPEGGRGLDPRVDGTDGYTYVGMDGRKFSPVFYRTSCASGPLPKRIHYIVRDGVAALEGTIAVTKETGWALMGDLEGAGRASEAAGRVSMPAGRALEPTGRTSETAGRAWRGE